MEPERLGRYELVSVLGRGGSGVVYEAVMHGLAGFRKRVALKLLTNDQGADDTEARGNLQREARLGALLSHPNVVSILDLGRIGEQWFIAMELVTGAPVSALLRAGPLSPPAILEIGIQACAGLAHIHELRVDGAPGALVHRDVKPQNLLVDENGLVKIADFGIAALSGTIDAVGTPTWMAPEQMDGRTEPRSDLFALGAVLFALAVERPPFGTGRDAVREAARVETHLASPAFLAPVHAAVPGLGEVLYRCLRRNPADRWLDANALGQALRDLKVRHPAPPGLAERVAAVRGLPARPTPYDGATPHDPTADTVVLTPHATVDLPATDASFVGRTEEHAELVAWAAGGERLLTVLGPGGVGKSRLAHAAATAIGRRLPGGAIGLSLADTRTVDGVCAVVSAKLHLPPTQTDPVVQIGHTLRNRGPAIVVLDDAERAIEATAKVVARWLELAPDARFLVTSRMPLRLRSEKTLTLGPLGEADGIALFRARAASAPAAEDDVVLGTLVRQLDGLPLAIELAAARSRVMSPKTLLDRLGDRFRLLSGDARDGRHATLRASIDASWDLLQPWEKAAMGQLAVFADGIALEDAEAALDLDDWPDAPWALDVLSALVDMSLLRFDATAERFRMMVSVQEYALGTLTREQREAAIVRHGEAFARLGQADVMQQLHLQGGERLRLRLHAERENLGVACRNATERGHVEVAAATAIALGHLLRDVGPLAAGEEIVSHVLELPGVPRRDELLVARGQLRWFMGQRRDAARKDLEEARAIAEAAGSIRVALGARSLLTRDRPADEPHMAELRAIAEEARRKGEPHAEARALSMLGMVHKGRWELAPARACLEQALVLFKRIGNTQGEALAQLRLGLVDREEGRAASALKRSEEAARLFRACGDRSNATTALNSIAVCHTDAGRIAEARTAFEAVVAQERETGHIEGEASALANLAVLDRWEGKVAECRTKNELALRLAREAGAADEEARVLGNLAFVEEMTGDFAAARRHLEASTRIWRDVEKRRIEADTNLLQLARLSLAEDEGERALRELDAVGPLPEAKAFDRAVLRIEILLRIGRVDEAAEALAKVQVPAASRKDDGAAAIDLALARARVALARGDVESAHRHLSDAEAQAADRVDVWLLRAEVLDRTGDTVKRDRALGAAVALLEKSGSRPGSILGRALARLKGVFGVDPRDRRRG